MKQRIYLQSKNTNTARRFAWPLKNNTKFSSKSFVMISMAILIVISAVIQPWSVGTAAAAPFDDLKAFVGGLINSTANRNGSGNSSTSGIIPGVPATLTARVTGIDIQNTTRFGVGGTDLGIPFRLENGSVGFIFGDTFAGRDPGSPGWRSQVMLRSNVVPGPGKPIVFDSAAGIAGNGFAPELIKSPHDTSGRGEFSAIPNDGISFPENVGTGRPIQVISYQSVRNWDRTGREDWATNYSGLAVSYDGNTFRRVNTTWNNAGNNDPYQMVSMQRDGNDIYMISVKAGRQNGLMMLRRVAADQIFNTSAYQCWNGSSWGGTCQGLFSGRYGEPSLRKLNDGTWAMAYLNLAKGSIVTRTATSPSGPWTGEKIQVTGLQHPNLYGGFIHPYSTADNVTMMVSSWVGPSPNNPGRYDVSQFNGRLR